MSRRSRLAALLALLALSAAAAPHAHASTFDIFGVTARDVAMGGAMTGATRGYSALYYNPGALIGSRQQHLGLGLTVTAPALYVDRGDADRARPTVTPDPHVGLHLGWAKPIPGIFDEKLTLAVSLYVPATRLVRVQGVDPLSPHFYLYQNLQDKLVIHAGLGVAPAPWLSLGLGVQVLADLGGGVELDMNILGGTFDRRDMRVTLTPTASLVAGLLVRPAPGLSLGVSYRGSSSLEFQLPVVVSEGDALDLTIRVAQTVLWSPHQLSFGAAWDLSDPNLTLALDATLALWSGAPDPSPRLSVDVSGRLLDAFGLADALDLSTRTLPIQLGFSDTLIARLGAEWEAASWLTLRAGYFFRPTPAPRQTSSAAYLDNDAHVVALGVGFAFISPLRSGEDMVELDLAAQLSLLPRRTVGRLDPRDPIGDMSHGGALWTVTATVSHAY